MQYTPGTIEEAMKAVCPLVDGETRHGNWSDKSTWTWKAASTATDAQKEAAQAVIDAADVPLVEAITPRQWTPYEFYSKFTSAERSALKASTDAQVQEFISDLQLFQVVYPDSSDMATAMEYLVSLGILTEERKTEILK